MIYNTETKSYTIIFTILLSIIVGFLLAIISTKLKPFKDQNKQTEKYQNILKAININVSVQHAHSEYKKYIKKIILVNNVGNILKIGKDLDKDLDIDISYEKRKNIKNQKMPIYIANYNNLHYYIIPLVGQGLWGEIFGYISFNKNIRVSGIVLDHTSETPGLGAEINQSFFMNLFKGEYIFDDNGNYMGIKIVKGNEDPKNINKRNNQIDGISGATKTCDGVSEMLINNIKFYLPFFKNIH